MRFSQKPHAALEWMTGVALCLVALLSPQRATASPIHRHCAPAVPWNLPAPLTPNATERFPIEFLATAKSLVLRDILIPLNAPPSRPNCPYEVSDLTFVSITLALSVGAFPIDFTGMTVDGIAPANAGPFQFTPVGGLTKTFTFPTHEGTAAGDVHLRFPNATIDDITLTGGTSTAPLGAKITSISLSLVGNHYFIAIPEPGTAVLLMGGGSLGLLWRKARRRYGR